MTDTKIDIPLFRNDLTYEELHELLIFMIMREMRRAVVGSERVTGNVVDSYVLRALVADDFDIRVEKPYSEYESKPLYRVSELAPEFLRERLEPLVWDVQQIMAKKAEDLERSKLASDAVKAAAANKTPTQEEIEWAEEKWYGVYS